MTSDAISEISISNDNDSIIIETKNTTKIKEYQDNLKLLADNHSLVYNYALAEAIRLMDDLVERRDDGDVDVKVMEFAAKAAECLSDFKCNYFSKSTGAKLELFLNAVSSVLHILLSSVTMIQANVRDTLYKSVSDFWAIYRKSTTLNANIIFSLREIRNCLRQIKDDQSNADLLMSKGGNVVDTIVSVLQKEYFAAFGSFIKILDFEYAAGEWYYEWRRKRKRCFILRRKFLADGVELEKVNKFYRRLLKNSRKELDRIKRKNTVYRNVEYKLLKYGGAAAKCSLPDNIDTLLIGYLHLMQQLLGESKLFSLLEGHDETIALCNEIIDIHIKKQLTFKAVEVLFVIKEKSDNENIKNEIDSNIERWSSITLPPPRRPRPLSVPVFSSRISQRFSKYNASNSSPDSTFSTPPQPPETKKERRNSVWEMPTKVSTSNFQHFPRKRIIDDVKVLFEERCKVNRDIEEARLEHNKLLSKSDSKGKGIKDSDSILSELKKILIEKEKILEEKERMLKEKGRRRNFERSKSEISNDSRKSKGSEGTNSSVEDDRSESEIEITLNNEKIMNPEEERSTGVEEKEILDNNEEKIVYNPIEEEESIEVEEREVKIEVESIEVEEREILDNEEKIVDNPVEEEESIEVEEREILDNNEEKIVVNPVIPVVESIEEEEIFEVDEILKHQNYLNNEVTFTVKDLRYMEDKMEDLHNISTHESNNNSFNSFVNEFDGLLYLDNFVEFDDHLFPDNSFIDEILKYQNYLDNEVIVTVKILRNMEDNNISTNKCNNNSLVEEFDIQLYLDNFIEFEDQLYRDNSFIDEILKYQDYLDNEVTVTVKVLFNMGDNNYISANDNSFVEEFDHQLYIDNFDIKEFDDKLYLDNYEIIKGNETQPLIYISSDPDEYDIDTLRKLYPADNPIVINIINIISHNNNAVDNVIQPEEEDSFLNTVRRFFREVENLVEKASRAHQAAVNNEKLRKLAINSNKSVEKEKVKEEKEVEKVSEKVSEIVSEKGIEKEIVAST